MRGLFAVGVRPIAGLPSFDRVVGFGDGAALAAEIAKRDGAPLTLITAYGPDLAEYSHYEAGSADLDRAVGESRVLPPVLPSVTLSALKGCDEIVVIEPVWKRRGDWMFRALVAEALRTVPAAKLTRIYGTREGATWKSGRT